MASFPATVVSFTPDVDYSTVIDAVEQNSQWAEIVAIETALGLYPGTLGSIAHTPGTLAYNVDVIAADVTILQTDVATLTAGSVATVTATDTSIVITGTSSAIHVATGTLDVIATNHPPAANWSNNGKKITSLENGSASGDAAAFGQIPTSAATIGGLATTGGTMSGAIAMGSNKITGLANGSASGDAVAFGQLPLAPRVSTLVVSSSTYTPNSSTTDLAIISLPTANFTVANPSGSPSDGQKLIIRINSSGTGYTPSWGSSYLSSGISILFTSALPASKNCTFGFIYDASRSLWIQLAADTTGY